MRTSSGNDEPRQTTGLTAATTMALTGTERPGGPRSLSQPLTTGAAVPTPSTSSGERPSSPKETVTAVQQMRYEVPWQLLPDDPERWNEADGPREGPSGSDHGPQSLARFAGLLTRADLSAVVACREDEMTVETTSPLIPGLLPGAVLPFEDHLGPAAKAAIGSLLAGRSAWADCLPPPGFRSTALIAVPSLATSKRLVLVASVHSRFEKRDLGFAAAYLAQARQVARQTLDLQEVAA
jgi:hypothetical protein